MGFFKKAPEDPVKLAIATQELKEKNDVRGLVKIFDKSDDYIVHLAVITSLAEVGNESAMQALLKIAKDNGKSNPDLTRIALGELFIIAPPDFLDQGSLAGVDEDIALQAAAYAKVKQGSGI